MHETEDNPMSECLECNMPRTLFGDTIESNWVVASVLILLSILAVEFLVNFEIMQNIQMKAKKRTFQRRFRK